MMRWNRIKDSTWQVDPASRFVWRPVESCCARIALTVALPRLIESLLFSISATDLVKFAVIALLLILVALLPLYIPARRATKVDPIVALRYE